MKQKVLLTDKRIKEKLLAKINKGTIACCIAFDLFLIAVCPIFYLDIDFGRRAYKVLFLKIAIPILALFMIFLTIRAILRYESIKKGNFFVIEEVLDSVEFVIMNTGRSPFKKTYRSVPVLNFRRCRYVMIESTEFDEDIEKLEREIGKEFYLVFASAADNTPLLVYSKKEYERHAK